MLSIAFTMLICGRKPWLLARSPRDLKIFVQELCGVRFGEKFCSRVSSQGEGRALCVCVCVDVLVAKCCSIMAEMGGRSRCLVG